MPLRKPNPNGRVRSTSRSPHRPVLFDNDEYPKSWYGGHITPYLSDNEGSSRSSLSSQSSPGRVELMIPGPVSATRGDELRELAERQLLLPLSLDSKYARHPDPSFGDYNVAPGVPETDDWLHIPDKNFDGRGTVFTRKGFASLGCLALIAVYILWGICAAPILYFLYKEPNSKNGGWRLGGVNLTGQIMETDAFGLVDKDTPKTAMTKQSPVDGRIMQLVFSDEFEREDRTFWPGDDPYWEAENLGGKSGLEWYDPEQVYTRGGKLVLELNKKPRLDNHGKAYVAGMLTSWNKFCFTGGLIEASVQLPGSPDVLGYKPAIWTMGNLGKAGYGATTEGLWPYSYEACDIGTVPNQTENGFPDALTQQLGDRDANYVLSFLPGQRLSSCTCPGEPHPGPMKEDGTYVARSAPEIGMFEGQMDSSLQAGAVSQSAQFAPFNGHYQWDTATHATLYQPSGEQHLNNHGGDAHKQSGSVVSKTNQACYQLPTPGTTPCYSTFGFQYRPGYASDGAHITWINDDALSWKLNIAGFGPDSSTGISSRVVSKEPMYMIMNLGMNEALSGKLDLSKMTFQSSLQVDWIRVYQYEDEMSIGCNPADRPTSAYIDRYSDAYKDTNFTTWTGNRTQGGFGQKWPKNSRTTGC